ncbi:hypothetical protein BGX28_003481 [Mortierella sp. GBA30]|nr:hypothetical protein BGX28_003481 [Mortierella sp. GBA30]
MSETIEREFCLVEKILAKRTNVEKGIAEYLIKWQGTDAKGKRYVDTWEPEHNIIGEDLLVEFEQEQAVKWDPSNGSPQSASASVTSSQEIMTGRPHSTLSQPHHTMAHPDMRLGPTYPYYHRPAYHYYLQGRLPSSFPPQYSVHPTYERLMILNAPSPMYDPVSHKRKAGSSADTGPDLVEKSASTAQGESTKGSEDSILNSNLEAAAKRPKDEQALRSHRFGEYFARRHTAATQRDRSTIIRPLQLGTDREKADLKALIEKSNLIKNLNLRKEIAQFVVNPRGLNQGAALLEFGMWLIEIKAYDGKSMFLALDTQKGVAMALRIPEWMLENQRSLHPDEGLKVTDRAIVSAIMAGNIHDSGLYPLTSAGPEPCLPRSHDVPSLEDEKESLIGSGSPSILPRGTKRGAEAVSDVSQYTSPKSPDLQEAKKQDVNGPRAESEAGLSLSSSATVCGWVGCNRTHLTTNELLLHVQRDHLQIRTEERHPNGTHAAEGSSPSREMKIVGKTASSWATRYEVLEGDYRSLQGDIIAMYDKLKQMDQQVRDADQHYTSAIATTKQNIKRLEAALEWEQQKWDKYQNGKAQMMARDDNMSVAMGTKAVPDSKGRVGGSEQEESVENQTESNSNGLVSKGLDRDDRQLDKAMEAQALNTIREIQRMLAEAKENDSRLKEEREALFGRKRAVEEEYKKIDASYQRTIEQLAERETLFQKTCAEVKVRTQKLDDCKASMEQEEQKHLLLTEQLRSKIKDLRQSKPSWTQPEPQLQQQPQPQPSTPLQVQTETQHLQAATNGQTYPKSAPMSQPAARTVAMAAGSEDSLAAVIADPTNFIDLLTRNTAETSRSEPQS